PLSCSRPGSTSRCRSHAAWSPRSGPVPRPWAWGSLCEFGNAGCPQSITGTGGSPSRCPRYNRALPAASDAASFCKLPQTQQCPACCCGRGPAYCSCYGNLRASSALRRASQKVLLEVGVVFQPSCGGLLVLVALVLVQHEVLQRSELFVAELEVADRFGDVGELIAEALVGEGVNLLGIAESTLRVLEVTDGESVIGPVRVPQGHGDVLTGVGGRLQLREHG